MMVMRFVAGSGFDKVIVIVLAVFGTCSGVVVVASVGEGMQYTSGEITLSNHNNISDSQRHNCWPQRIMKIRIPGPELMLHEI